MKRKSLKVNTLPASKAEGLTRASVKLPANVERDVREFLSENSIDGNSAYWDKGTTNVDQVIANASVEQLFDWYLTWNGVIGYTADFIAALDGIRAYVQSGSWVATRTREVAAKNDAAKGAWHDWDGHLAALNAGQTVQCFCVKPPYVKAVR
jgi:hypothetical protein